MMGTRGQSNKKNMTVRDYARVIVMGVLCFMLVLAQPSFAFADTNAGAQGEASTIDFYVNAQIPGNQINKKYTYFDLLMEPEQKQELSVEVVNEGDEEIVVSVQANAAATNSNGVIDYSGQTPTNKDLMSQTAPVDFDELVSVKTPEVVIGPHSSAFATVVVDMPREEFDGSVLGGIVFQKKEGEESSGEQNKDASPDDQGAFINNVYQYVVAVQLSETDTVVAPSMELLTIKPELVAYQASPVHYFHNTQPVVMTGVSLEMKVYPKGEDALYLHEQKDNLDIAPHTVMAFSPNTPTGAIQPGEYQSVTTMQWEGEKWTFEQDFTVSDDEATAINEQVLVMSDDADIPWWALAIGALVLAVIILIVLLWRSKRKDGTHGGPGGPSGPGSGGAQKRPATRTRQKKGTARLAVSCVTALTLVTVGFWPLSSFAASNETSEMAAMSIEDEASSDSSPLSEDLNDSEGALESAEELDAHITSEETRTVAALEAEVEEEPAPELAEHEVIVYTANELESAMQEDNAYTTVYLGADIVSEVGGALHKTKKELTIDGRPPGSENRYSYTSLRATGTAYTFRVVAGQHIVIRNIDCTVANNLYGLVSGSGTAVFENITFSGRHLAYMRASTLTISNSDITVSDEELCECVGVTFEGKVNVDKTEEGGTSVIWLPSSGEIRIAAGAEVAIITANYFIYKTGDTDFIVEDGASFSLVTNGTSAGDNFLYNARALKTFSLGKNASFFYRNNNNSTNTTHGSLAIDGTFFADEGSVFELSSPYSKSYAIALNSGAQAVFNDPAKVRIFQPNGKLFSFASTTSSSSASALFSAQSINVWQNASGDEESSKPIHFWNKEENILSEIECRGNQKAVTVTSNMAPEDPIEELPNALNFNMSENTQLLTMGRYNLSVDEVTSEDEVVAGMTSGGAALIVDYCDREDQAQTAQGQGSDQGSYNIAISFPLAQSEVTVTSGSAQIWARAKTIVQERSGRLILTIPGDMPFGEHLIPPSGTVLGREDASWKIVVDDTRLQKSAWELQVRLASPLVGERAGQTVSDAFIYTKDGTQILLGDEFCSVFFCEAHGSDRTIIDFACEEGAVIKMPHKSVLADRYTASLEWRIVEVTE